MGCISKVCARHNCFLIWALRLDVIQFITLLFTFQTTVALDREGFNCNKLVVKVSVSRGTKSDMSAKSVDGSISLTKDISSICFAIFPHQIRPWKALAAVCGSLFLSPPILFTEVIKISLRDSDYVFATFIAFMVFLTVPVDSFAFALGEKLIIKCHTCELNAIPRTSDALLKCQNHYLLLQTTSLEVEKPWMRCIQPFRRDRLITGNIGNVYAFSLFWFRQSPMLRLLRVFIQKQFFRLCTTSLKR